MLSIAAAVVMLTSALAYANLTHDLPNPAHLPILLSPPDGLLLQPTRIYDRTGQHLLLALAPKDATRRYLPLNAQNPQHLPEALAKAIVAVEDPEFWQHAGYSTMGWQDPAAHPTLAQRLAADLLLFDEPASMRRAIRERMLAAQISRMYGRTQVLEWTLNYADFGRQAYGAEAAAQLYLGKSATELTLGESALLAATARDPGLNPMDAPLLARERRDATLQAMQALGQISPDETTAAMAEPMPVTPVAEETPGSAPAFARLVLSQLDQRFARERIERGGVIITTTLDYELQQQAACTTLTFASRLEGGTDPIHDCPGADLLPALPPEVRVQAPSASALILDPRNGQVLAIVGETVGGVEGASLRAHEPGSLMQPFTYLAAFTRGFSPATMVWDVPPADEAPRPGTHYYGPVRMRMALANDLDVPARALAAQLGPAALKGTEASFGLQSETSTLLDMAAAYGILATGGIRFGQPGPSMVLRVEGLDHSLWLNLQDAQAQPVLDAPLAYIMNHVLSDEGARQLTLGTTNPFSLERPAGVKIGHTDAGNESWVVGYTPSRVTAVWVGTGAEESRLGSTPRVAGSLWNALMTQATQGLPADGWLAPAGVTAVDVCDPSGMLPTADCPAIVSEIFLNGNEPTQRDNLYEKVAVNRETGLRATVFTPPELVEQKLFMKLPQYALEWAKSAGIAVAPTSYDAIQAAPANPNVHIDSPAMYASVNGEVQITGTATGEAFDRYRVLVGKGINPDAWITVGKEPIDPVENGLLATWDTSGLSGLYAIQLQVIHTDQRVETAIIQVTVGG